MKTWTPMLINKEINFGSGVFQSYKTLKACRNMTMHSGKNSYDTDLAKSAYSTALNASTEIWKMFFPQKKFKYAGWVEKMPAASSVPFYKYGHVFLTKK